MWDWLTSSEGFIERSHCGTWTDAVLTLYIAGNVAIAGAYFAIPLALFYAWWKAHKKMPRAHVTILFAAFIFFCGAGHVVDGVLPFWWPNYRFIAVWHTLTALISWVAVIALPHLFVAELLKTGGPSK